MAKIYQHDPAHCGMVLIVSLVAELPDRGSVAPTWKKGGKQFKSCREAQMQFFQR
jgi:hypothetical protein